MKIGTKSKQPTESTNFEYVRAELQSRRWYLKKKRVFWDVILYEQQKNHTKSGKGFRFFAIFEKKSNEKAQRQA